MVGYKDNYTTQAYHKAASCPTDLNSLCNTNALNSNNDNPNVISGGVVSGPSTLPGQYDEFTDRSVSYSFHAPPQRPERPERHTFS